MAQTAGFDPTTQVKSCFDCKIFDVSNWVANLNGEDGPGGMPSHEALSISSQGALEISSVIGQPPSMDRVHFCTPGGRILFKQICHEWFTPHVDLFATHLNHKLPLYVSPIPDPKAWDIDALNIYWTALTAYAYPPTALLHRVIQKIGQCHCLIKVIAPGWPGMPWFWDLVQLSTEISLQLPVSTTLLKQSHLPVFHSNLQHLNLHTWCLGVDNYKNKASLWRWQRELLPLNGHQQRPSTSQSGPYLKDGAEKIRWISPLHL